MYIILIGIFVPIILPLSLILIYNTDSLKQFSRFAEVRRLACIVFDV